MKAIILAGGEGTRLRPLSLLTPKPMLPLFDHPLLEHIIVLLRRYGFTDLCITVRYMSDQIIQWFGDGSEFGVSIVYMQETEARGTAGSVKLCRDFIGEDDFLVISGDAALDLNLAAFWEHHRLNCGISTILVQQRDDPEEFGLVFTNKDSCVSAFIEKPGPENICSDLVNTGIYAFRSDILTMIPENTPYDFGSQLFPKMLENNERIHTYCCKGYWNDIGSCKAYMRTCFDVLDHRLSLPLVTNIDNADKIWVSKTAKVSESAELLPYTILGDGCVIGENCHVESGILLRTTLRKNSVIIGSILGEDTICGESSRIFDGCVIGPGVYLENGSILRRDTIIWPDKTIDTSCDISNTSGGVRHIKSSISFQTNSIIEITNVSLSSLLNIFNLGFADFDGSNIAYAFHGGVIAETAADLFQKACRLSGKSMSYLDIQLPSAAAYLSSYFRFHLAIFFLQRKKNLFIYFYDKHGLPIPNQVQRKILKTQNSSPFLITENFPNAISLSGLLPLYCNLICREKNHINVSVHTDNRNFLFYVLSEIGVQVVPPSDHVPILKLSCDGFSASVIDETGFEISYYDLLLILAFLHFQDTEQPLYLPFDAPDLTAHLPDSYNSKVFRISKDNSPFTVYRMVYDGVSLLVNVLLLLDKHSMSFKDARNILPEHYRKEEILQIQNSVGYNFRNLREHFGCMDHDEITLSKNNTIIHLKPVSRNSIRLILDGEKAETSQEFYSEIRSYLN